MREVFTSCKKTKMILVDGDWSSGAVVMDIFFFFFLIKDGMLD